MDQKPTPKGRPIFIFLIGAIAYAVLLLIVMTGFLLILLK